MRSQFFGLRPWRRHSLVLLVAGLVYVLIGIAFMLTRPTYERKVALQLAFAWAPIQVWGGVFIFAGALAIISSRWPPISKTWGYMVLTGLSTAWAMFYLMGVVAFNAPLQNLSGFLSWGLIGFLWWAISGLRNPGEPDEKYAAALMSKDDADRVRIELSAIGEPKEG